MEFENPLPERFQEGFEKDLLLIGASLLLVVAAAGVNNVLTSDQRMDVGMTEIKTTCYGFEAGACIGLQKRQQITYNYDNYSKAEPGEPNYYRRAESELMAQAYNICNSDSVSGYEWTSKAEYLNKTGSEWRDMEEISLFPCETTYFRKLDAPN